MADSTVIAQDFEGHDHEVNIAQLQWRPAAYGIIIKESSILLLRQTNGYDLPGGGIDKGETPERAVIREIREETGTIAKNPKLITVQTSFYKPFNTQDKYVQSIAIFYQCDYVSGELAIDGFDEAEKLYAEAPEWIPLSKLDDIKLGTTIDFRKYVKQLNA